MAKRYRGENPAYTAWKRSWLQFYAAPWWHPYRPRKKWGAKLRQKQVS